MPLLQLCKPVMLGHGSLLSLPFAGFTTLKYAMHGVWCQTLLLSNPSHGLCR